MSRLKYMGFCALCLIILNLKAQDPIYFSNTNLSKANELFQAGEYQKAEQILLRLLSDEKQSPTTEELIEIYYLMGKTVMHQYRIDESLDYYSSMQELALSQKQYNRYGQALNAIMTIYEFRQNPDSVLFYARKILDTKEVLPTYTSDAYVNIGRVYSSQGSYDEAEEYLLRAYTLDSEQRDTSSLPGTIHELGKLYELTGEKREAIQYYLEAVELLRNSKDQYKYAWIYGQLSSLFYSMRNIPKAEEYIALALDQNENTKRKAERAVFNVTLAQILEYKGENNKAIKLYDESLNTFKDTKNWVDIVECYIGLSRIYTKENNFEKAKDYLILAENVLSEKGNRIVRIKYSIAKAEYLHQQGKFNESISEVNHISTEAIEQNDPYLIMDLHKIQGNNFSAIGNKAQAFDFHNALYSLKDSLYKEELTYTIHDMEAKYKKKEQDQTIALLDSQNQLNSERLKRQKSIIVISMIGLGLFGLFSFWLYRLNQRINNQNTIITKALQEKEILLKEIHHRVKNNLQTISSLLSLQSRSVKDEAALFALKEGQNRVKSMALIHQNLYQDMTKVGVKAREYIENLSQSLFASYKVDHGRINLMTDIEEMNLDVDVVIPLGLIINELITNALKYAFDESDQGVIQLEMKNKGEKLFVRISDNGVGLPTGFIPEESDSLGFRLIKAFSAKLNADLKIDGENGTEVSLTIPYKQAA